MNKKGFTLIELLAVIIILAIIALIAVPKIMGIIQSSREQATKNSVHGVMKSAEIWYSNALLELNGESPAYDSSRLRGTLGPRVLISCYMEEGQTEKGCFIYSSTVVDGLKDSEGNLKSGFEKLDIKGEVPIFGEIMIYESGLIEAYYLWFESSEKGYNYLDGEITEISQ